MTPIKFRSIRHKTGLSQSQLADLLRIKDYRTISRYECGERKVSGPVSVLLEILETGVVDLPASLRIDAIVIR